MPRLSAMSSNARADFEHPVRRAVLLEAVRVEVVMVEEEGEEEDVALCLVGEAEKPVSAKDFVGVEVEVDTPAEPPPAAAAAADPADPAAAATPAAAAAATGVGLQDKGKS